jgi:hypothetical protein
LWEVRGEQSRANGSGISVPPTRRQGNMTSFMLHRNSGISAADETTPRRRAQLRFSRSLCLAQIRAKKMDRSARIRAVRSPSGFGQKKQLRALKPGNVGDASLLIWRPPFGNLASPRFRTVRLNSPQRDPNRLSPEDGGKNSEDFSSRRTRRQPSDLPDRRAHGVGQRLGVMELR